MLFNTAFIKISLITYSFVWPYFINIRFSNIADRHKTVKMVSYINSTKDSLYEALMFPQYIPYQWFHDMEY